jgi:predicted 3-demethylubiquinone-9 3-methyltransferase (glyoxalase superfamily)
MQKITPHLWFDKQAREAAEFLRGDDKKRIGRVTQAFLKMKKFDIVALERAAAG